jgi:hypothetical protein
MTSGSLLLDRIEAVRETPSDVYVFVAVLAGGSGELRVPVPTDALLSYAIFQKTVLLTLGLLYINLGSEGRAEPAADEAWRYTMQLALDRGRATTKTTVH